MKIPIQPLWPDSLKAQPVPELPPLPRALLEEANHRLNVWLNEPGTLLVHMTRAYAFVDKVSCEYVFVTYSK